MVSLVSGIFAVAKAVPYVMRLVDTLVELYLDHQLGKLSDMDDRYIKERRAISNALENTESRDDLKALSIRLAELNRNFLSRRYGKKTM